MNLQFSQINRERDWPWIAARTNIIPCSDTCGFVAYDDNTGKLQGAVVFDSFTNNSALTHVVIDNPLILRHGFLEEAADFAFIAARRGVLYGLVPANNAKAIRFDEHIGWRLVTVLKDGYDVGIDYRLYEMRKEDCRWLRLHEPLKMEA
jgi:hypothetical protein